MIVPRRVLGSFREGNFRRHGDPAQYMPHMVLQLASCIRRRHSFYFLTRDSYRLEACDYRPSAEVDLHQLSADRLNLNGSVP